MSRWNIIILFFVVVLTGCSRTQPQSPSRRNGEVHRQDSTSLKLIEMNLRMAEEADKSLVCHVDSSFSLADEGYWIHVIHATDIPLEAEEKVHAKLRIFDMSGCLLEDIEQEITVGKMAHTQATTDAVLHLNHNDSAVIVAPWYIAYGSMGNQTVPPYTNVKIEIRLY